MKHFNIIVGRQFVPALPRNEKQIKLYVLIMAIHGT